MKRDNWQHGQLVYHDFSLDISNPCHTCTLHLINIDILLISGCEFVEWSPDGSMYAVVSNREVDVYEVEVWYIISII